MVTVTPARRAPSPASTRAGRGDTAVVLVLDMSGSMTPVRKIARPQGGAAAAIAEIRDGVLFAIVAGTHEADVVPSGDGVGGRHEANAPGRHGRDPALRPAVGRPSAAG